MTEMDMAPTEKGIVVEFSDGIGFSFFWDVDSAAGFSESARWAPKAGLDDHDLMTLRSIEAYGATARYKALVGTN